MGQTITEKIFSEHVGKSFAGEIVRSKIDMVIGNDITTPISIKALTDGGLRKLSKSRWFCNSFVPLYSSKRYCSTESSKNLKRFCYETQS